MSQGIFRSRPRGYRPREAPAEPTTPPPGAAGPSAPGTPLEPDDEVIMPGPPDGDDTSDASASIQFPNRP